VHFLDGFSPEHRRLFEDVADRLVLTRGQMLMRRGEPGGDVYVITSGTLDVVDSRQIPEIILLSLHEGAVVGDLAFLDDSPRSADVRAAGDVAVLRWSRDDLRALLKRHTELAATFYAQVSRLAAERIRALTEGAVSGAYLRGTGEPEGSGDLVAWAARISADVKEALPAIDADLRRDPNDAAVLAKLEAVLDRMETDVDALFAGTRDPAAASFAAGELARELHPYLTRSSLAEHAVHRSGGVVATADLHSHVLRNVASGKGRLGEVIDRWLLDRPTFRGLRAIDSGLGPALAQVLPTDRERRVTFLTAGSGRTVLRLMSALSPPPTVLTLVDAHREALAAAGGAAHLTPGVRVATVQENVVALALGRAKFGVPDAQDAIVLPFVLESLPERIAVALLSFACDHLAPGGAVVLATLGPSRDRTLVDRLLGWPTIRRNRQGLTALVRSAGLEARPTPVLAAPAELLLAGLGVARPGSVD
jgi:extracellular factor (EF) 3-hydroxypalmitic acid methyl ester biosynthesis protein